MDRLALLADEGPRFVAAIERGDADAVVPGCPDWTLRELVHHTGGIHRWATRVVSERRAEPIDEELEAIAGGWPEDDDLAAWFRAGHTLLVDALRAAPEDLECWSFLRAASPLEFWTRRQLHETTIHRVDAEHAAWGEVVTPIPVEQAVDGIDELLTAFLPRRSSKLRPESTVTFGVQPNDADAAWLVTAGPEGATTERVRSGADLVLQAPAAELYLLLWNRGWDELETTGDASLLDVWRSSVQVRWS